MRATLIENLELKQLFPYIKNSISRGKHEKKSNKQPLASFPACGTLTLDRKLGRRIFAYDLGVKQYPCIFISLWVCIKGYSNVNVNSWQNQFTVDEANLNFFLSKFILYKGIQPHHSTHREKKKHFKRSLIHYLDLVWILDHVSSHTNSFFQICLLWQPRLFNLNRDSKVSSEVQNWSFKEVWEKFFSLCCFHRSSACSRRAW